MRHARLTLAIALLGATAASAARAETTAFTHATVHTASGPVIENATIVVVNGKIRSVGTDAPPAGAQIVDCAGKHVWPGFVAPWTALGLVEVGSVRGTDDAAETGTINPNVRSDVEINPDSELLPVARFNGITSAVVVPGMEDRTSGIGGASALIHLDGWTHEDMTIKAPLGLHVYWPAMGISHSFFETRSDEDQKKARDEAIRNIENAFDDARAYVKARAAEGKSGIPRHDQDVRWDAMARALRGEIPVVFHAAALNQIQACLKFADERGLKNVVLADGYDAWRIADELKRRGVAVVLGPAQELPRRSYEAYDQGMTQALRLYQAGVRFCLSDGGGSGNAANARNLPYEAAYASAYGLPRDEALKAVTLYPAQIFGVADKIGSIEPGKIADLVVGDGDPLEIETHVEQVYIAGKAVSMENRQTRLFHKYDARPRGPKARPRSGQTTSMR